MVSFIHKYYLIFFVFFVATIVGLSFYLGYQKGSSGSKTTNDGIVFSCPNAVLDKQKISTTKITPNNLNLSANASSAIDNQVNTEQKGIYVGSKNGTKYYTPGCSGTNRIKAENYVWFQSVEDATLQGYSKGSC